MSDDAPPRAALLGRLAVGVATIQAGLSLLAWVVSITGREGLCGSGAAWSCAALLRPRLGELGPLHVTQVAIGGAFLTLVALVILRRTPLDQGGLRLGSLAVPAAGAGLALAAGVLTLSATRALCPLCLLVAISALTASGLAFGSLPTPERRRFLQVFGLVLVLGCGLSLGRGLWLRSDDRARKARLEQIGGPSGPQLLLVTRPGCAFCTTLELDVLADPSLADALGRTRGLERIDEADPRAKAHAGGRGAPVLIALDAQGRSLGRLRGVEPIEAVRAFLVSVAPVRSR